MPGRRISQAALQDGKGVILVTGHFGAVEFLPGALALNGYSTSMICRFQTTRLRESMGERAEAVGLHLIDADEGNIILSAMKALRPAGFSSPNVTSLTSGGLIRIGMVPFSNASCLQTELWSFYRNARVPRSSRP